MIRLSPIALAAALLATGVSVAVASPGTAAPASVRVATSDLDLASVAGRATLDTRLRRAAGKVCAIDGARAMSDILAAATCRREALVRTDEQVRLVLRNAGTRLAAR